MIGDMTERQLLKVIADLKASNHQLQLRVAQLENAHLAARGSAMLIAGSAPAFKARVWRIMDKLFPLINTSLGTINTETEA